MVTAPNVMAHIPQTTEDAWYRLGSTLEPEADDIWINTTLPDGTHIVCGEPEGWEGVEFITPIDTAGGRDGGLVGPPSIGPRYLEIDGAAVAPDAATLRRLIRAIRAKLGPRKQVTWEQYDLASGLRLGMVCYPTGGFTMTPVQGHMNGGVATRFRFTLVAANPTWKLSTGAAEQACTSLPVSPVTGRTYDKTYDYSYGAVINPGGTLVADNQGDLVAWPVFEITGPVDHPVITNDSTGSSFGVTDLIPAGETVTIDARTGIVEPGSYQLAGRPFGLAPGQNTIRWQALFGTFDEDALLCVSWRHTLE